MMGLNWEAVKGLIGAVILQLVANTKFKNVVLAICMQNIALKIFHVLQMKKSISLVKSMQWSRRLGKNLGAFIFN